MKTIAKRPPKFQSYEEEATFWDTHDITDYAISLENQPNPFKPKNDATITIRFNAKDLQRIRKKAH